MKSKTLIFLYALVCIYVVANTGQYCVNQYRSDKCGYYIYLPALFIYHDLARLSFYGKVDSTYNNTLDLKYSMHAVNGRKLNKYPIGVAVMQAPLFFAAHAWCSIDKHFAADGFSMPYQCAGLLTTILLVAAGLFLLSKLLRRYYSDAVTAATLLCIALGTNLYAYTAFEGTISHAYSFFLFACLLALTERWYRQPGRGTALLLGLTAGMIFITRPINIVSFIVPLLWGVYDAASLRRQVQVWVSRYADIVIALLAFAAIALLQLAYWKYTTGQWFYYSYVGEGFNFMRPEIVNGLFSVQKGWFLYTPMAALGLFGLAFLWRQHRQFVLSLALFFAIFIYAVFCWHNWWYGCGFSARALVEALAFLALPLAALVQRLYEMRGKVKKAAAATCMVFLVLLNVFQTYQYSMSLLDCGDSMTWRQYWHIFGMYDPEPQDYRLFLETPKP